MRDCTQCRETKPETEFYRNRGRLNSACKECRKAASRAYHHANITKVQEYRGANREQRNVSRRQWYLNLRTVAVNAYGGRCACCGESEYAFLVFDHVDGGGMRERIENYGGIRGRSGGHRFLVWLREHGYPPEIQVLCANCNMAKHFREGGCPHARS
jgi:hypothetical protein